MNPTDELKMEINDLLSFAIPGAEHMPGFGSNGWSGRSTLFGWEQSSFPAGFLTIVYSHLKQKGY